MARAWGIVGLACWLWAGAVFAADPPGRPWSDAVEARLVQAGGNREQLETALRKTSDERRAGMEFLVLHMPDDDLRSLTAEFLLANHDLAYEARSALPWGRDIPDALFLNHVLPYANVDERREPWRREMYELCLPIVKDCKTPSEAAVKLNTELFQKLKVKYAPQRRAPNLSPKESIEQGNASCTGLSILLSDACRAVCVPARLVGTPNWYDKRGNHTWIEIWDRDWHFTGACEQDPQGLNRGWFVGDAARAKQDSPEHAIYATSFRRTGTHFPLVWARDNRQVPGENVTDRYAKPEPPTSARAAVRVVDSTGRRVAEEVTVTGGEPAQTRAGRSRDESADLNDLIAFELPADAEFVVRAAGVEKKLRTGAVGSLEIVELTVPAPPADGPLGALAKALADAPENLAELAKLDFARSPLSKADAATARRLLWAAHAANVRKQRAQETRERVLKDGDLQMPYDYTVFGKSPPNGRSLWISLHGGGGAPKPINDQQWQNQKRLYTVDEGVYLAPRAPTNTWNLWHEAHIDRLFARLIENLVVLENVDPDRVYLLGYSAGGDGVYQMAPRMADRWAGAAMMAGHPNGVPLLSLRNVPFALQVGANDSAYNRAQVGREYGEQLAKLREADPQGYLHFVKIHEGKGHWMDLEDKAALPWMAKSTRNATPDRVVWKQSGVVHDRSYWLAVPPEQAKMESLIVARRDGQTIELEKVEAAPEVLVRLDERLVDLDRPVVVKAGERELYRGTPARTIATLIKTLTGRGDPKLMFEAEIAVRTDGAAAEPVGPPVKPAPVNRAQVKPAAAARPAPLGYVCLRAEKGPTIDGKLDDPAWQAAAWSDDFVDIEGDKRPKPRHRTRMKMTWDDQALYVAAEMVEPNVWATLDKHDSVIFHDNDFEVFIDPDGDNFLYGELELNALNTTWDLMLPKPYKDGGRAQNGWEIIGLKTATAVQGTLNDPSDTDQGWTVEIAWPWSGLAELTPAPAPPKDGQQWRINFSRVQWDVVVENGRTVKVKGRPEHNWVWSPQGVIDMHRPERWGYLQFSDKSAGPVEFKRAPGQEVRDLLHEIYYAQRDYQKANGRYAAKLEELALPVSPLGVPRLHMTPRGYEATIEVESLEPKLWGISSDSQIWSK